MFTKVVKHTCLDYCNILFNFKIIFVLLKDMPEVEMHNMIYTVQSCYAVFSHDMIQLLKC